MSMGINTVSAEDATETEMQSSMVSRLDGAAAAAGPTGIAAAGEAASLEPSVAPLSLIDTLALPLFLRYEKLIEEGGGLAGDCCGAVVAVDMVSAEPMAISAKALSRACSSQQLSETSWMKDLT